MPYIAPEAILEAKEMDLLTYLRNYESHELVRLSDKVYTTKTHDSLKISNGKWMWWSQGIGGVNALDYLIKVRGMNFIEACETIIGHSAIKEPMYEKKIEQAKDEPLLLPERSSSTEKITEYLFNRGIDFEIINYCIANKLIIESLPYHNAVFIGYDENKEAKYAAYRATSNARILGDCTGSKKQYSFRLVNGNGKEVHLFECAIDLLSFATLCKLDGKDWRTFNLVSLSGVYSPAEKIEESKVPVALEKYLSCNPNIKKIILHFDNDTAGVKATETLKIILPDRYEVVSDPPPRGKDFNDFLCLRLGIAQNKERRKER